MTTIHSGHPADTLKMIRETLCIAQSEILHGTLPDDLKPRHALRLGRLIDDIDKQRPLGTNGKHGNLHTEWCQCEDK